METPEEMYSRLMTPPSAVGFITLDDVIKLVQHYRSQVQVLRGAAQTASDGLASRRMLVGKAGLTLEKALAATEPNKWSE